MPRPERHALSAAPLQILVGTIRLAVFVLVFWMFFAALVLSSSAPAPPRPAPRFASPPRPLRSECECGGQVESQRGIYEGLNSAFDFERLKAPAPPPPVLTGHVSSLKAPALPPATPSDVQRRPAYAGARARTRAESRLHAPLERPGGRGVLEET